VKLTHTQIVNLPQTLVGLVPTIYCIVLTRHQKEAKAHIGQKIKRVRVCKMLTIICT